MPPRLQPSSVAGHRQEARFPSAPCLTQGASPHQELSNSEPEAFLLGRQTGASGSPVGCGRLRLAYLSGVQGDGHPSDETWVEGGLLRLQSLLLRCGSQSQGSVVYPELG